LEQHMPLNTELCDQKRHQRGPEEDAPPVRQGANGFLAAQGNVEPGPQQEPEPIAVKQDTTGRVK
jgi:hypothetical protein